MGPAHSLWQILMPHATSTPWYNKCYPVDEVEHTWWVATVAAWLCELLSLCHKVCKHLIILGKKQHRPISLKSK